VTLSYLLTVQNILWKADSCSACQTVACFVYGTRRFFTVFTKARQRTLSWASRIQFAHSIPVSPQVHLNVIVPPMPRSSQWSLTFGPPNQNPVRTSPLPMRATCSAHLITLTIFDKECRLWSSSLCSFLSRGGERKWPLGIVNLHNLYPSLYIIRANKPRRVGWARHARYSGSMHTKF